MKSLTYAAGGVQPPIVFLHGIPGIRSKQNRDIAEVVARETKRECFLPLYAGLGHAPGTFSFQGCKRDVLEYVESVLDETTGPIDLVGHSWGGFLSILVSAKYSPRVRRLALMSPLVEFQKARLSGPAFAAMARSNPELMLEDPAVLDREFLEIHANDPIDRLIASLPVAMEVLILQAEKDEITPAESLLEKAALFKKSPVVEMIATDHSFVIGRESIAARLARFLA